jgi:hypothetical protein
MSAQGAFNQFGDVSNPFNEAPRDLEASDNSDAPHLRMIASQMIKVMSALPAEGEKAVRVERIDASNIADTAIVTTRAPYDSKFGLYSVARVQKGIHLIAVKTPSLLQLGSVRNDTTGNIATRWIKLLGPDTDKEPGVPFGIYGLSPESGKRSNKKTFEKWNAFTMVMHSIGNVPSVGFWGESVAPDEASHSYPLSIDWSPRMSYYLAMKWALESNYERLTSRLDEGKPPTPLPKRT